MNLPSVTLDCVIVVMSIVTFSGDIVMIVALLLSVTKENHQILTCIDVQLVAIVPVTCLSHFIQSNVGIEIFQKLHGINRIQE